MTKITVVVSVHNYQQWIVETLNSVRAQTYPRDNVEVILIDRGSSDASIALARWFLARHAMRGTVLCASEDSSLAAAMNVGWRAASGEWIQFIQGQDLLAANKFEIQANLIPRLANEVGAICSSWQRITQRGDQWQATGPVNRPDLTGCGVLKLVSLAQPRLGAALFRKKTIEAVGGFSEEVAFAVDEHLMLKIAGTGRRFRSASSTHVLVEATSSSPLFLERKQSGQGSRRWKIGFAREHLENVLIAREILRDHQNGVLMSENTNTIARLCDESWRELCAHDWTTFKHCLQSIGEVDPHLLPKPVTRSKNEKAMHLLVSTCRQIISRAAALYTSNPRAAAAIKLQLHSLRRLTGSRSRGLLGSASRRVSGLAGPRAGLGFLTAAALIVTAVTAMPATWRQLAAQFGGVAPIINVPPTIYAEPSAPWPMPVEISSSQRVPPDSILRITGLPAAVALSQGSRVSADVWGVSVARLTNLEVFVAAGASGKFELTLALVGANGSILAETRTVVSIREPSDVLVTAAAGSSLDKRGEARQQLRASHEVIGIAPPSSALVAEAESANTRTDLISLPTTGAEPARSATRLEPNERHRTVPRAPELSLSDGKTGEDTGADASQPTMATAHARASSSIAVLNQDGEPKVAALLHEEQQRTERIIERRNREMTKGNIAMARPFFLRAAKAGVSEGAFLLASTYDPHELNRPTIVGVQPNAVEARKWYERARELGSPLASQRLIRLETAR